MTKNVFTQEEQELINGRDGSKAQSQNPFNDVPPKSRKRSTRHKQVSDTAATAANSAIAQTVTTANSSLTTIKDKIAKVVENRQSAIEDLSDVMAALHDPRLFEAEVMARTAEKIGESNAAIDILIDPYEGVDFGYTAILPATIVGALPAC